MDDYIKNVNKTALLIGAVIVVILCVIWLQSRNYRDIYENYMTGLWIASEEFTENAEISSMRLFIGPYHIEKQSRAAYLLINDNVTNQLINLKYAPHMVSPHIGVYTINMECEQKDKVWPVELTFEFDIIEQSLTIYSDDQLYGFLYKDGELSHIDFNI